MMGKPTIGKPRDIYSLNLLANAIVNFYVPGDTVFVGMSPPKILFIYHLDMVGTRCLVAFEMQTRSHVIVPSTDYGIYSAFFAGML